LRLCTLLQVLCWWRSVLVSMLLLVGLGLPEAMPQPLQTPKTTRQPADAAWQCALADLFCLMGVLQEYGEEVS
jgi:hypothetical protein